MPRTFPIRHCWFQHILFEERGLDREEELKWIGYCAILAPPCCISIRSNLGENASPKQPTVYKVDRWLTCDQHLPVDKNEKEEALHQTKWKIYKHSGARMSPTCIHFALHIRSSCLVTKSNSTFF